MSADYPAGPARMIRNAPARTRRACGGEEKMEERRPVISRRVFLQAMAATGLAVACGPSAQPIATGGNTAATLSGTITVSYPDELGAKPKYVDQAAQALKTKYSGLAVKIDLQKISSGDYYTKLLLALSGGGDVPDVIHVGGDRIGELADAGYIEPLDKYVSQWDDWKNYPQAVKDGVSYQGKVWAIPYGLDMRWLYIRRDAMDKAGLSADWTPKNVDDILNGAKAVKDKVSGVIPYALYAGQAGDTGTANHSFVPLVWAYGGDIIDKSGKWIGNSDAIRKALDYYQRTYSGGLTPKEILTSTKPWTAMRENEGKGTLALLFEGGWVYGGWQNPPFDKSPTDANYGKVIGVIQKATGNVASGQMSVDDAAKRYADDLKQAIGADKVITQ